MQIPVYPIKFVPILKEKIWGGDKLKKLFGRAVQSNRIGESWEISGIKEDLSIVENGILKGNNLEELIARYGADFLGKKVMETYGKQFPLLFKFIDAKEDLSVQLHPNDEIAKKRHNSFGKTEMWYILQADEGAGLYLGFNRPMEKQTYLKHLSENTLEEVLHFQQVKEGDIFYIPPGKIHAIGGGVMLAEIQQTSDITYRVYDWNRPDINGKLRELHNDLALEAIDFENTMGIKQFSTVENERDELVISPYFSSSMLMITDKLERNLSQLDSFVVYMCVSGEAIFHAKDGSELLKTGETLLLPASCESVNITSKNTKLLEVFVP